MVLLDSRLSCFGSDSLDADSELDMLSSRPISWFTKADFLNCDLAPTLIVAPALATPPAF